MRLGDRGVLVAIAMLAAIEGLEKSLRAWATLPLDSLPKMALLELAPLRAAYDELVDVLEGAAPTPAAERAAAIARDIIATRDAIEPPSKTEKRAIEQAMMTLAGQRERVDEDLGRLQHLIDGGRFDDSPTKWKAKKESKA